VFGKLIRASGTAKRVQSRRMRDRLCLIPLTPTKLTRLDTLPTVLYDSQTMGNIELPSAELVFNLQHAKELAKIQPGSILHHRFIQQFDFKTYEELGEWTGETELLHYTSKIHLMASGRRDSQYKALVILMDNNTNKEQWTIQQTPTGMTFRQDFYTPSSMISSRSVLPTHPPRVYLELAFYPDKQKLPHKRGVYEDDIDKQNSRSTNSKVYASVDNAIEDWTNYVSKLYSSALSQ